MLASDAPAELITKQIHITDQVMITTMSSASQQLALLAQVKLKVPVTDIDICMYIYTHTNDNCNDD